jgi:hypothetical protein
VDLHLELSMRTAPNLTLISPSKIKENLESAALDVVRKAGEVERAIEAQEAKGIADAVTAARALKAKVSDSFTPGETQIPTVLKPASVSLELMPGMVQQSLARVASLQRPDGLWQAEYLAGPLHPALASIASNEVGEATPESAAADQSLLLTMIHSQGPDGSFTSYPGGPKSRASTRAVILAIKVALEKNPALVAGSAARAELEQADQKARAFLSSSEPTLDDPINTIIADTLWHGVYPDDTSTRRPFRVFDFAADLAQSQGPNALAEAHTTLHHPLLWAKRELLSQPVRTAMASGAILSDVAPRNWAEEAKDKALGIDRPAFLEDLKQDVLASQDGNGGWLYLGQLTAMSLLALKKVGVPNSSPVMKKGIEFLRSGQHPDGAGGIRQSFSNGELWDSALSGAALLRSGVRGDDPKLMKAIGAIVSEQQPDGRWSFAVNSQHGMENDTTNVNTQFLALAYPTASASQKGVIAAALAKASDALLKRQQSDGGWNAWQPTPWSFGAAIPGGPEALGFDASTADVTGRVMGALAAVARSGAVGEGTKQSIQAAQAKGVGYLRNTETANGWWSRWITGYVTTGAWTVPALRNSGIKASDPAIVRQRAFLVSHQNADGGFGETTAADRDPKKAGRGPSTPVQTALALQALIAGSTTDDIKNDPSIAAAAKYLIASRKGESWDDVAVYTANPGVEYYRSSLNTHVFITGALLMYDDASKRGVTAALARYSGPGLSP